MKYQVVQTESAERMEYAIEDLEQKVQKLYEDGWKPQGGISIAIETHYHSACFYASQAMIC